MHPHSSKFISAAAAMHAVETSKHRMPNISAGFKHPEIMSQLAGRNFSFVKSGPATRGTVLDHSASHFYVLASSTSCQPLRWESMCTSTTTTPLPKSLSPLQDQRPFLHNLCSAVWKRSPPSKSHRASIFLQEWRAVLRSRTRKDADACRSPSQPPVHIPGSDWV
jgi:hypothetical protein